MGLISPAHPVNKNHGQVEENGFADPYCSEATAGPRAKPAPKEEDPGHWNLNELSFRCPRSLESPVALPHRLFPPSAGPDSTVDQS